MRCLIVRSLILSSLLIVILRGELCYAEERLPSQESMLRAFDITALSADRLAATLQSGSGHSLMGSIRKWDRSIKYKFEGLLHDAMVIDEAKRQLLRYAEIAGLTASEVDSTDANFILRLINTPNRVREGSAFHGNCTTRVTAGKQGSIRSALVQINLVNRAAVSRCISHELLHGFGLQGHPHELQSVLSYSTKSTIFDLTVADRILLHTLYDSRLVNGMPRIPALIIANDIMSDARVRYAPNEPPPGIPGNVIEQAIHDLMAEADKGDVKAILHLIQIYRDGIYVQTDTMLADDLLLRAEASPDVAGRFELGYAFAHGVFVEKDLTRAAQHYLWSAEQGHRAAQISIGNAYRKGMGVKIDKIEALKWYSIAAGNGGYELAARNRDNLASQLSEADRAEATRRLLNQKSAK